VIKINVKRGIKAFRSVSNIILSINKIRELVVILMHFTELKYVTNVLLKNVILFT
jgi:hypothetical protein